MGLSKKKTNKKIKITSEEVTQTLENVHDLKKKEKEASKKVKLSNDQLFSTNIAKNFKEKREKLKKDRFKEIQYATTSKTEENLLKRFKQKYENSLTQPEHLVKGSGAKKQSSEEELYGGELSDIWGSSVAPKSKNFNTYLQNQEKNRVKIKQIINPKGGLSYNPNTKDHKQLLKDAAKTEEQLVEENLKELKKTRPLLFAQSEKESKQAAEDSDEQNSEGEKQEESEESSDSEDVDMDKPLAINKEIDRLDIKTQAQRNKAKINKIKEQQLKDDKKKRVQDKNIERLDNLVKQDENEGKNFYKKLLKRENEHRKEIHTQETVGVVTKPKKIGRWKYKQRKLDYQLEDDLSGNLRQMRPLGNDLLLQDRFDSVFRRNMVELDAPTQHEKNRRQRKVEYKMYTTAGAKAKELHLQTQELKKQNDMKSKSFKKQKNDDMIMI